MAFLTVALLSMVAPGAGFRGGTLFRSKSRWRPKKKSLHRKISEFLVQMDQTKWKNESYSQQIDGVMISHHNMMSPQNGDTRSEPPPLATPLIPKLECKKLLLA